MPTGEDITENSYEWIIANKIIARNKGLCSAAWKKDIYEIIKKNHICNRTLSKMYFQNSPEIPFAVNIIWCDGWGTRRAHTSPINWLDDRSPLSAEKCM